MRNFIALYHGRTVSTASIVAVSADPDLIAYVSSKLLAEQEQPEDPVLTKLHRGRRGALRAIKREAEEEHHLPGGFRIISRCVVDRHLSGKHARLI